MRVRCNIVTASVLAMLLAGCGEGVGPLGFGPTPTTTATPTATATSTATPTATATATSTPTDTPTATATPVPPFAALAWRRSSSAERVWGLQFAMEFDPERQVENLSIELPRARDAGLTSIRTSLRWDVVEPRNVEPAAYDYAEYDRKLGDYASRGFDTFVSLVAYPGWATEYGCGGALEPGMEAEWRQFVRTTVERYSQEPYRVSAWEIGNEVDGESVVRADDLQRDAAWGGGEPTTPFGGCWGGRAEGYAAFLKAAYEEIKAVHPEIPVTIGGLAYADVNGWFDLGFLDQLLAAGGGAHFDFLGYHWFANLRDHFPGLPTGPEKLRRLEAILARYDSPKPIWLTETYRFSTAGQPESRRRQLGFLTKELVEVLAASDLRRVYWYGWVDFPAGFSPNERGLVAADHQPKLAFPALRHVIEATQGRAEDLSSGPVAAYRFTRPGQAGSSIVAWTRDGAPARLELPAEGAATARVKRFPEDMLASGECCEEIEVAAEGDRFAIELGADARIITVGR